MKKILSIALCGLAGCAFAQAQQVGQVTTKTFKSAYFPFERDIFIYTPAHYDELDQTDMDVIYVFDSQWRSHFALVQGLIEENQIEGEDYLPFIVVGVPSAYNPEYKYERNNDFTPEPQTVSLNEPFVSNTENFRKFLTEEVMAYVNDNYRTSGHTLGVGHSLSGSFVIDAMTQDGMFDDIIAVSPNLEWDTRRFANDLLNYDYADGKPRFISLTIANESEESFGPEWRPAWDDTKAGLEGATRPDNVKLLIKEYPDYSHMQSYVEALKDMLPLWAMYRHTEYITDPTLHPVHIELTLPGEEGDVYITGNQEALANWNPQGVKMTQVNDTTYSVDLKVKLPAEYKFTRGSWDNQPFLNNSFNGNQRIHTTAQATKRYQAQ